MTNHWRFHKFTNGYMHLNRHIHMHRHMHMHMHMHICMAFDTNVGLELVMFVHSCLALHW
jgi:hypothetical protein